MKHQLFLGSVLVPVLVSSLAASQEYKVPRIKHYQDGTKGSKNTLPLGKVPNSKSPQSNLRQLEQQSAKTPAAPRAKRNPVRSSMLRPEKEKPTPPINFSGPTTPKVTGMTSRGNNPYKGRLRQKGSRH
jgi:hypothetical protein